jgi:hypothetical protein
LASCRTGVPKPLANQPQYRGRNCSGTDRPTAAPAERGGGLVLEAAIRAPRRQGRTATGAKAPRRGVFGHAAWAAHSVHPAARANSGKACCGLHRFRSCSPVARGVLPALEAVSKSHGGWINALRPSTRPLRGRLRMRKCYNAINNIPHAEGARRARLEARTASMQPCIRRRLQFPYSLLRGGRLLTLRQPRWISKKTNRLAVPLRLYSQS